MEKVVKVACSKGESSNQGNPQMSDFGRVMKNAHSVLRIWETRKSIFSKKFALITERETENLQYVTIRI